MRHPNASPLLLRLYSQEINLPIYERSARVLSGVGLSPQQQLLIVEGVEKLIMSSILETVGRLEPKSEVLDGERFPFLRTMLTEAELDEDRLFSETVYRLLDGVAPPAVDEPPEPLSIEA